MSDRLTGKVALVTGSSSGIGQSIAVRLAAEGAAVAIDYVGHSEGAEATKRQIESAIRSLSHAGSSQSRRIMRPD